MRCNSTLTTQFPLFQGGSWVLQNTRLHFPAPKHYTCVCGYTTGARCAFTAPEHAAPGAPASSDTAALQDQGGRITHLRDPKPRQELQCCDHNKINAFFSEKIAKVKLLEAAWALGAWQELTATQPI